MIQLFQCSVFSFLFSVFILVCRHIDQRVSAFGGEEDENVEEFLRRLERRVFICCKGHKLDFAQQDQIKLRYMESLLTGRALGFWKRLSPAMRNSYELAAATLEGRFPGPFQRAIIEMNSLI